MLLEVDFGSLAEHYEYLVREQQALDNLQELLNQKYQEDALTGDFSTTLLKHMEFVDDTRHLIQERRRLLITLQETLMQTNEYLCNQTAKAQTMLKMLD